LQVKYKVAVDYTAFEARLIQIDSLFGTDGRLIYDERNKLKGLNFGDEEVTVKRYRKPHFINRLAYGYFRKSKAERAFNNAERLIELGIQTPPPVGFLEQRNFVGLQHAYYVCLYQPHKCTIRKVIDEANFPNREQVLRAFAQFTVELQNKDIHFVDHSPGNTLLLEDGKGEFSFSLVDINRMRFKKLNKEQRYENFSKLTTDKRVLRLFSEELASATGANTKMVFRSIFKLMRADQTQRMVKRKLKFWKR